jgi:CTP-dependent riboflavin kinase
VDRQEKEIREVDQRLKVKIASGQGKGRHFVDSLLPDDAIIKMLKAKPFPGTLFLQSARPLNFRGISYREIDHNAVKIIPGYLAEKFVVVKWTRCYPNNLQVVSDINLRQYLELKDGEYSEIRFPAGTIVRNTPRIYWLSTLQWVKGTKIAALRRNLMKNIRAT